MRGTGEWLSMDLLPLPDLWPGLHQADQQPWQAALVSGPVLPVIFLGPVWAQCHHLCAGL